MHIDSLTIYCLATGKPIAQVNDDESGFILDTVPTDEMERLCLASMRPSLPFMRVTPSSLDAIRESAPRQLLAYLLNRLYAHCDVDKHGKPLSHESWLTARRMRIHNWQVIESADFGDENLDTMLFLLLDLDSRFSLTKLVKPQSITGLWDSWHHAYASTLIQQLTDWRTTLVAQQIKLDKQAAYAREFWSEGNRLTRQALVSQFNRVPPVKRDLPLAVTQPKVAKTAHQQRKVILAARVDILDQLEREMTAQPSVASVAVAKPRTIIRRFGVKQESN